MSKTYYKYQIKCVTEDTLKYWILDEDANEPTICPDNTAHTVDPNFTDIVQVISDNIVTIKEESRVTDGDFFAETIKIDAIKNAITTKIVSWPYNVSILSVEFITDTEHEGDTIDVCIGEDTIIGYITADVSAPSVWTTQNYIIGDKVTYTDPIHGPRVYTCISDTVSNDIPTDTDYWKHGFELSVSSTVSENVTNGNHIKLFDGVNQDNLNRVISHDKSNYKVYLETSPTNSFSALTPTYVQMSIYMIKDFEFGPGGPRELGSSKIGGAHIPTDTLVTIKYNNKSSVDDKTFVGTVEYLH